MLWEYVKSVLPTIGVVFIFVIAIRGLFQADRRERAARARIEAEEDRAAAARAAEAARRSGEPERPTAP